MKRFHKLMLAAAGLAVGGHQGMTLRQIALLELLSQSDGAMQHRDVSAALQVQKPVVTRASQSLAHEGLLRRMRADSDGRDLLLSITPRGREVVAALTSAVADG